MKLYFIMVLTMLLSLSSTMAQQTISGKVTDDSGQPLPGATLYLPDLNKGSVSDKNGDFILNNLPSGHFRIQCSFVGYSTDIQSINILSGVNKLDFRLQAGIVESQEIVISGGFDATQHENAVKIEKLPMVEASSVNRPGFTMMLTRIPGVEMISKGSGVSKPVIRGLSMNDILSLNNGVRIENYQYSSHHPLGIDEFGISEVEVIKGPASLLYGSDAIGGVINFIREKPAQAGTIQGDLNSALFSNTLGISNNVGIKGAGEKWNWGFRAGNKSNADFLEGGGTFVPNSRFLAQTILFQGGYNSQKSSHKIYFDNYHGRLGLVEEEAVALITKRNRIPEIFYQELNSQLLSSQNKFFYRNSKLEVNAAGQSTHLTHIGQKDEKELEMQLQTLTWEAKVHFERKASFIAGIQGLEQKNLNLNNRETILLPDAKSRNLSGFVLVQSKVERGLRFQAGLRFDHHRLMSDEVPASENSAYRASLSKTFSSLSGSAGATWNITHDWLLRANVASAYRTPKLAELTSDGQHEARYEIGNPLLKAEKSIEADLSTHHHIENMTLDVALFYNHILNFIFIAPTGTAAVSGLPIYRYTQGNATLKGFEAGAHYHPAASQWIHLYATFNAVYGTLESGDDLPFIPSHKAKTEIRFTNKQWKSLKNSSIGLHYTLSLQQKQTAPEETLTARYHLFDLSIGTEFKIHKQQLQCSVGINNLFDVQYFDHLSLLKELGYHEAGRNFYLSVKLPFEVSLKGH